MKYMTDAKETSFSKKSKRCVYCGFSINIKKGLVKECEK